MSESPSTLTPAPSHDLGQPIMQVADIEHCLTHVADAIVGNPQEAVLRAYVAALATARQAIADGAQALHDALCAANERANPPA